MGQKRPWNAVNEVVYSLMTTDEAHGFNANMCTYVVPISRQPKKYLVALDYTTRSYENFKTHKQGILHILSHEQKHLMRPLGKKSGHKQSKMKRIERESQETWRGYPIFSQARVVIDLSVSEIFDAQDCDHALFVCDMQGYKYLHPDITELMTNDILG